MLAAMASQHTVETPEAADGQRRSPRGARSLLLVAVAAAVVALGIVVAAAVLRPTAPEQALDAAPNVAADTPALLGEADRAVGRPLPETTLPALGDFGPAGGLQLPATGEPMVINFWASWCAPCVNEMPMLQRVADDLDVPMVGVDFIDQAAEARALAEQLDIRYTLVRDDDGAFGDAVGLLGTPTTLIVDADGIVQRRLTGELTEDQFRAALADVLG